MANKNVGEQRSLPAEPISRSGVPAAHRRPRSLPLRVSPGRPTAGVFRFERAPIRYESIIPTVAFVLLYDRSAVLGVYGAAGEGPVGNPTWALRPRSGRARYSYMRALCSISRIPDMLRASFFVRCDYHYSNRAARHCSTDLANRSNADYRATTFDCPSGKLTCREYW
jgi:hypothetical protein